jgi:hypothetical protein
MMGATQGAGRGKERIMRGEEDRSTLRYLYEYSIIKPINHK